MLKYVFLAGVMTIAAPVLAQTAAPVAQDAPIQATTPALASDSLAQPTPDAATPAAQTPAAPAGQVAAQPATTGDQVAAVVDSEFPSYDKNADGDLDRAEFTAWMVALKTASDPATAADSAETKSWVGAAFAQADKDKSTSVTKTELTGFLSQGAS